MAPAIDAESEWISRVVVHDDPQAFAALVRLHQAPLRRFLRRLCGTDWARADDLAQETLWKAYRHIGTFRGERKFLGWLFRIAWQQFVTQQRRGLGVVHETWVDDQHATDDVRAELIDHHALDQLLLTLRDEERAGIVLHHRHGLTHAEIAVTLALPLGTVKTLIRRARLKMQRAFETNPKSETP